MVRKAFPLPLRAGVVKTQKQNSPHLPLAPDWLVGLVTDVEASSLKLDDVSLLQVLQTWISKHLLLQLKG